MQLIPWVQDTHAPRRQTLSSPQAVPSETFSRSVHTGAPVEHSMVAARQGFEAAHASPEAQPTQAPAGLQTLSLPQEVPAGCRAPVVEQAGAPVSQERTPRSHGFSGAHAAPAVHAMQAPAEHTLDAPQAVPSGILPVGRQEVVCPSHAIVPVLHSVLGWHGAPSEGHCTPPPSLPVPPPRGPSVSWPHARSRGTTMSPSRNRRVIESGSRDERIWASCLSADIS